MISSIFKMNFCTFTSSHAYYPFVLLLVNSCPFSLSSDRVILEPAVFYFFMGLNIHIPEGEGKLYCCRIWIQIRFLKERIRFRMHHRFLQDPIKIHMTNGFRHNNEKKNRKSNINL